MKQVALGEVARIDRTPATDADCRSLPYVGLEHIEKDTGRFASDYDGSVADMLATQFRFTSEHVLYGKLRPYLNKVAMPNFDGVCTTEILPLLPKSEKLDRTYLWAMLLSPKFVEWASRNVSGANLPRLAPSLLAEYPIPLPPLAEQQRIAGLLRRADRLRRLRRYALAVSAGYLQAVFVAMFGDPVRNPMGWEQQRLGEVIAGFQAGVNIPPISENEPSSEWRVLKVSAVTWGDFDPTASKAIPPDTEFDASLVVRKGDLLISRANTTELVGAVSLVRTQPSKVLLPDKLWRICFKENSQLSPEFTLHALRQEGMRKAIGELATGSSGSMKNISQEKAAILLVTLPPLDLQVRFGEIAERSERVRLQQREALRQAEHLFQALLRRAFV